MDYKITGLETFAIAVCYLLLMLPVTSATHINIIFNGEVKDTVQISPENMINKQITIIQDPDDIGWTNVKVHITINSATLAYNIKKIYLYKCRNLSPLSCAKLAPQSFDEWADTELSWSDISEQAGVSTYPQVANILIIAKLEDVNGRVNWVGYWSIIKRKEYNIFDVFGYELDDIELHASSLKMIEPIKNFINNKQMIPFNWVSNVTFKTADALYALGASSADIEESPPAFQAARPSNDITVINKDYYFVLSNTTSGIAGAVTLNLNPEFTCGNNDCEMDLGETQSSCCYDCGCPEGSYCDLPNEEDPSSGECRNETIIALDVTRASAQPVSDCTNPFTMDIMARINNPPSNLPSSINGNLLLNDTLYSVTCTGGPSVYTCPVTLNPNVQCGAGSYAIGPNMLNFTLSFRDGDSTITKELSAEFSEARIDYNCECAEGYYCSIDTSMCRVESSINLQVLSVPPQIKYNSSGNVIKLTAKINNAPSDLTIGGTYYTLGNITYDSAYGTGFLPGASGTVTCSGGASTGFEYNCTIPADIITNYNRTYRYVIRSNSIRFAVTFSNGGSGTITKDLTSAFTDVLIPPSICGDQRCQTPDETSDTCCLDCGCPNPGDYCDSVKGCQPETDVKLVIDSVTPQNLTDCKTTHQVKITARILNSPTNTQLNYYYFLINDDIQGWNIQCTPQSMGYNTGLYDCILSIPEIEGCSLPYYVIGPNKLRLSVSFPDGSQEMITKEIEADVDDIIIAPTWHCGLYGCEADLGEDGSNCCIDCACADDPDFGPGYYCDYDPTYNPNGTCMSKDGIRLVIDKPVAPVHFDSCEISQRVNIKAHVENQPSGMMVEHYYGKLGGNDAPYLTCLQKRVFGTQNSTVNCTLVIPRIYECSKGETYSYLNNTLSLFISYTNGMTGARETKTLTASYPKIEITQKIRSLYDIMQDAIGRLKGKMYDTIALMEELIEMWQKCIKLILFTTIAMIAMTFIVPAFVAGDLNTKGLKEDPWSTARPGGKELFTNFDGNQYWEGVKAMSVTTQTVIQSLANMCEMISKIKELQLKMVEMEMRFIKMEMCIEVYQHQVDTGKCKDNAQGCFNSIASCLDFGYINNFIDSAKGIGRSIGGLGMEIGSGWQKVGEAWQKATGTGKGALNILINGNKPLQSGNVACNRYPDTTPYGKDRRDTLNIKITAGSGCNYPVVTYSGVEHTGGSFDISIDDIKQKETWTFELYCYTSEDKYINAKTSGDLGTPTGSKVVHIWPDTNEDGICTGDESGTAQGPIDNIAGSYNLELQFTRPQTFNKKVTQATITQPSNTGTLTLGTGWGELTGSINTDRKVVLQGTLNIEGIQCSGLRLEGQLSGGAITGSIKSGNCAGTTALGTFTIRKTGTGESSAGYKYNTDDHIEFLVATEYKTGTVTNVMYDHTYDIKLDNEYGGYEIYGLAESAIIGKIKPQTYEEFFEEKKALCENTYDGELCGFVGVGCEGEKYYSYYWFSNEYGTREFICCTKGKCVSRV